MIASPSYFSKKALDGAPLGRELELMRTWQPVNGSVKGRSTVKWNSSLSHPINSGIRLYECSFISVSNPSNPRNGFTP
jgi:hypothetical protein